MASSGCVCSSTFLMKHYTVPNARSQQFFDNQRFASPIGYRNYSLGHSIPPMSRIGQSERKFQCGLNIKRLAKGIFYSPSSRSFRINSSWMTTAQIASNAFSLGTVAVLPFYTLMIASPKSRITRKIMESNLPYVLLGLAYAFLLYLSWTPDTFRFMFSSKYWLPELPGIAKMFANEMTLASAWIHLLAVDLFAARQVFFDGLEKGVETRHSVSFCLLFCPVGILCHYITKALIMQRESNREDSTRNLSTMFRENEKETTNL